MEDLTLGDLIIGIVLFLGLVAAILWAVCYIIRVGWNILFGKGEDSFYD